MFGLTGWLNTHADGNFMTIKQKVGKLKASLMYGRSINVLRDSIKKVEEKETGFYLGYIKLSLVCFVWRIASMKVW